MTENRAHDDSWNALGKALGGRYRDGTECPLVYDLFVLAEQRAHLDRCAVCRRTYQAALDAARSEAAPTPDGPEPGHPPPPKPSDRVDPLDLFFPNDIVEGSIRKRLGEQTIAKVALVQPCLDFLRSAHPHALFIESGSTTALALQAAIRNWSALGVPGIIPWTNNFLLNPGIWARAKVRSRLLYGNRVYNHTYAGCFPVSEQTIERAFKGDQHAKYAVTKAWESMVARARGFDALFMTASRFHFFCGPFVGSADNALLKAAFFAGCRAPVQLLIDGSKLLLTADVAKELARCIQVTDADFDDPSRSRPFRALYPQGYADELVDLRHQAAQRNPTVRLKLRNCSVRYRSTNGGTDYAEVTTPDDWGRCIEGILSRQGSVTVCISEPDVPRSDEPFGAFLRRAINEANGCFERNRSRVRIAEPEAREARVDPRTLTLDPSGAATVTVWTCPMVLNARVPASEPHDADTDFPQNQPR